MPTEEEGGVTPPIEVPAPEVIDDFGQGGGGDAIITIDPPIIVPPSDFSLSGQATVTLPVFVTISLSGRATTSVTPVHIRSVSLSGFATISEQPRFVQSVTLSSRATVNAPPTINFALALNGKASVTTDPIVGGVVEASISLSGSATVDLDIGYTVCECPDYLFDPVDDLPAGSFRSGVFIPIFRLAAGSVFVPATTEQTWIRRGDNGCLTYGPVGFQFPLGPLMLRYANGVSGTKHDGSKSNSWKRRGCD
jgi:hypothetical protein